MRPDGRPDDRGGIGWWALLAGLLAVLAGVVWRLVPPPADEVAEQDFPLGPEYLPPSSNRLALGEAAAVRGPVPIPIAPLADFDGLTREEILALRRRAVAEHAGLLRGEYAPSPAVFGAIEDGRPWWGLAGRFYFGRGERSIDGFSTQSPQVLNPFLLAGAEFWHDGKLLWSSSAVPPEVALDPAFPYLPPIASLTLWPDEARGEVVYEFSRFLESIAPLLDPATPYENVVVDLVAYNARDMGLAYLHVSPEESENIHRDAPADGAAPIPHFLHRGGSCGYPGGCNNVSPRFPAADGLRIDRLPATIVVKLWQKKPVSAAAPPDFVFVVRVI